MDQAKSFMADQVTNNISGPAATYDASPPFDIFYWEHGHWPGHPQSRRPPKFEVVWRVHCIVVRGFLGTDPPDLTLESASPSPERSIWHRLDMDSTSISWFDPISVPNQLRRGWRGGFQGGVRGVCAQINISQLYTLRSEMIACAKMFFKNYFLRNCAKLLQSTARNNFLRIIFVRTCCGSVFSCCLHRRLALARQLSILEAACTTLETLQKLGFLRMIALKTLQNWEFWGWLR